MTSEQGVRESREFDSGEIVYLVKHPGEKWRIDFYECRHGIVSGPSGGLWLQYAEIRPEAWQEKEFENPEAAVTFFKEQIEKGAIPRNKR